MGQTVPSQVAVPPEDLAAAVTVVWFDVGVRQEMGLEVAALVEGPIAGRAPMGGLLKVKGLVNGQGTSLTETLATIRTFEWLLLGMDVSAAIRNTNKRNFNKDLHDRKWETVLKGQYDHNQRRRLSTGHGIGVLVINTVTENYWLIIQPQR